MPGYGEVTGQVIIASEGVPRELVAVSFDPFDVPGTDDGNGNPIQARQVVGSGLSANDGSYTMQLPEFGNEVVVVALDVYGEIYQNNKPYAAGERIRPTAGNETGYVYECTVSGVSGGSEPVWWVDDGGAATGQVGTATFKAIESWWPVAHAPIQPVWFETGSDTPVDPVDADQHIASVVALANFSHAVDEASRYHDEVSGWPLGFLDGAVMDDDISRFGAGGSLLVPVAQPNPPHAYILLPQVLATDEDFTIEFWWKADAGLTGEAYLLDSRDAGLSGDYVTIYCDTDGHVNFYTGGADVIQGAAGIYDAAWHHIALARIGGVTRLFLDGAQQGLDYADTAAYFGASVVEDWAPGGAYYLGANAFNAPRTDIALGSYGGYRFTFGVARYTGAYLVPSEDFPLTRYTVDTQPWKVDLHWPGTDTVLNLNDDLTNGGAGASTWLSSQAAFVDDSRHGTHSLSVGVGGYLNSADIPDFGTANFSIELWVKGLDTTTFRFLIDNRSSLSDSANGMVLYCKDQENFLTYWHDGSARIVGSANVRDGKWHHVALHRNDGRTVLKVDGIWQGHWGDTADYQHGAHGLVFGAASVSDAFDRNWLGQVDDIRIHIGDSRYEGSFNPPAFQHPVAALEKRLESDSRVLNWTDELLKNPQLLGADDPGWEEISAYEHALDYGWRGGSDIENAEVQQWVAVPAGALALAFGGMGRNTYENDYDCGTAFVRFYDAAGDQLTGGGVIHGSEVGDISSQVEHCLIPSGAICCLVTADAQRYEAGQVNNYNHGRVHDLGLRFLTVAGDSMPVTPLTVTNWNFNSGNLAGWNTLTGSAKVISTSSLIQLGAYIFTGNDNEEETTIYQDVDIPAGVFHLFNVTAAYSRNYSDTDHGRVIVQALDAGGAPIAAFGANKDIKNVRQKMRVTVFERLPAGTAKLRIMLVVRIGITGSGLNCALGDVQASLMEDSDGTLAKYLGL